MISNLHHWTEATLAEVPIKKGFRQRGMDVTRLETFTDAAFAFAVTLLVISVDDVPRSYEEFTLALKQIPAFLACFLQLMLFWWGHHTWSRRFGLEDGASMLCSLALVAAVLIYIYPLRVIFGAFFANASGGVLPEPFPLDTSQIGFMFIVFGTGFSTLSGLLVVLHGIALRRWRMLALSPLEILQTRGEIIGWSIAMITGLVSTLMAVILPVDKAPLAGFVYWTLAITMPSFGFWFEKRTSALPNSDAHE
jgi:transmembrane protein TMEM174 (potassium channel)